MTCKDAHVIMHYYPVTDPQRCIHGEDVMCTGVLNIFNFLISTSSGCCCCDVVEEGYAVYNFVRIARVMEILITMAVTVVIRR